MDLVREDIQQLCPWVEEDELETMLHKIDDRFNQPLHVLPEELKETAFLTSSAVFELANEAKYLQPHQMTPFDRFFLPKIDFENLSEWEHDLLNGSCFMAAPEKGDFCRRIVDHLFRKYEFNSNLPAQSWHHVALQVAERNLEFTDEPSEGKFTVMLATKALQVYAALKLTQSTRLESDLPRKRMRKSGPARNLFPSWMDVKSPLDATIYALQVEFKKEKSQWNVEEIRENMEEVYPKIKHDLQVEKFGTWQVKEKYPFLMKEEFLLGFYTFSTLLCAKKMLLEFMEGRLIHTYNYITRFSAKRESRELIAMDCLLLNAQKEQQSNQSLLITTLMMVHFLLEDVYRGNDFIRYYLEEDPSDELIAMNYCLPNYPIILAQGADFMKAKSFIVCIDGAAWARVGDFPKALCCCYALCNAFSASFPRKTEGLWEFIEKAVFWNYVPSQVKEWVSFNNNYDDDGDTSPYARKIADILENVQELQK